MGSDCGCAFLALRMLARVEELTTTSKVPLETALQITEEAESHSLAVLSCEPCRQQRLPLTAITVLSARLVDWLRRSWRLDDVEDNHDAREPSDKTTTNTTDNAYHESRTYSAQPRKFSLGSYNLDPEEADVLGHELMTLRLTRFSAVLGSLEAALLPSGHSSLSLPPSNTVDPAAGTPTCLELVQSNLRLLRACIRRLKDRSLLSTGSTTANSTAMIDVPMLNHRSSAQISW